MCFVWVWHRLKEAKVVVEERWRVGKSRNRENFFFYFWRFLVTSQSINRVSLDSSSYRFSAHWAKIKCSICSSEFDRFERVHATLLMIKRLFGQGSGSGACSCPVMGRLGIAVPPRTAHTHSHFGSVSSYLSKAKLYRQQVVRSFENRRIDVRSLAEKLFFFFHRCFHFFCAAVFTFSQLLFSLFLHCSFRFFFAVVLFLSLFQLFCLISMVICETGVRLIAGLTFLSPLHSHAPVSRPKSTFFARFSMSLCFFLRSFSFDSKKLLFFKNFGKNVSCALQR